MLRIALFCIAAVCFLGLLSLLSQLVSLYIQALLSNAKVGLLELVGMRLRKTNPRDVVFSRIRLNKAGILISVANIEAHIHAGGRIHDVLSAFIAAHRAGIYLDWETACSIDLGGDDVIHAVTTLIETGRPEYIPIPAAGAPVHSA